MHNDETKLIIIYAKEKKKSMNMNLHFISVELTILLMGVLSRSLQQIKQCLAARLHSRT